ncbi:hypothetical protein K470DRAFT_255987 [Piedraia hortae CBS 480.64]|uniref:CID domain-containing protein n=1 Tax=Piedraia hortae CBS 480.64 TaxID=1314780 RepID=A0A6A7C4Q2_9PEZI|nr:hypothetical protein K470DRAFT_255987 [Piedraia hortae CBS 480.64]
MTDPFEVRMRFTSLLIHLNASSSSAIKAAQYALRHVEYADDLFSCILEQLENPANSVNNRANIMFFLPRLCEAARDRRPGGGTPVKGATATTAAASAGAAKGEEYVTMVDSEIARIVDAVAPPAISDTGGGSANVRVVRQVLTQLGEKGHVDHAKVGELLEVMSKRDLQHGDGGSPGDRAVEAEGEAAGDKIAAAVATAPATVVDTSVPVKKASVLDRRQIEQRIEEDRERHKRARESIWMMPQAPGSGLREDAEFDVLWKHLKPADEDDYLMAREEKEMRLLGLEYEVV